MYTAVSALLRTPGDRQALVEGLGAGRCAVRRPDGPGMLTLPFAPNPSGPVVSTVPSADRDSAVSGNRKPDARPRHDGGAARLAYLLPSKRLHAA